jgi:hypothetical protein
MVEQVGDQHAADLARLSRSPWRLDFHVQTFGHDVHPLMGFAFACDDETSRQP